MAFHLGQRIVYLWTTTASNRQSGLGFRLVRRLEGVARLWPGCFLLRIVGRHWCCDFSAYLSFGRFLRDYRRVCDDASDGEDGGDGHSHAMSTRLQSLGWRVLNLAPSCLSGIGRIHVHGKCFLSSHRLSSVALQRLELPA